MNVGQSTIEKLLYILLLLIFIGLGVIYAKIAHDDNRKFHVLKSNQDQLICIVKGFRPDQTNPNFIDKCIQNNQ